MFIEIPGYLSYLLDTDNYLIYSLKTNKYLSPSPTRDGHLLVYLYKDNKRQSLSLHRLIYETCIGAIPNGYVIHHIDGNPQNNSLNNLCCISSAEHKYIHQEGRKYSEEIRKKIAVSKTGKQNPSKWVPILMFDKEGNFVKEYNKEEDVKLDGFLPSNVCKCCQGTRKSHKGFQFKYKLATE